MALVTQQDSELAALTCWWSGSAQASPASDSDPWPHSGRPYGTLRAHHGSLPIGLKAEGRASPWTKVFKWVAGMQPAASAPLDCGPIASGWRRSRTKTIFD